MKRAAFWIYAACLVSAPILFGAVHAWTYTFVFLGILFASALVFLGELGERLPPPLRRLCGRGRRRAAHPAMPASAQGGPSGRSLLLPSALFFLAVVLFLAFQMTALPEGLLRLVSPMAKIAGDLALPPWETAFGEAVPGRAYSVAPYAYPVRMSLVRWIVYGLLFFGLLRTLDSRRRRITGLVTALLVLACLDALYGLMESSSAARHVLWMKALGGQKDVSGTFINRNHFAGFMEMGIILAVLYAGAYGHGEKRRRRPPASRKTGWRGLLLGWTAGEAAPVRRALIVFAGAVMFVALILSASRAGIVTAVFVLFLVGGLLTLRRRQRKMGLVVLALFCVTASYALTIGIDYTIQRFQAIHGYRDDARGVMTQDALRLFRDYRLVGVGFGNFAHAYPRYQSPILKGELVAEAHNDWAQLLAEGGVAGFVLVLAGVGCLVFAILRQWRRREDTFAACLGLAPVAALGAMAVHSFFDFNLHIPANFLTMVAIAALGAASLAPKKREGASVPERLGQGENASSPGRPGRGESAPYPLEETGAALASPGGPGTRPPARERRSPRAEASCCGNHWASSLFFAALLGLACWSGYWTVRHFVAEAYCNTEVVSPLRLPERPPLPHIEAALAWDPANAEYGYRKARALMEKRDALGAVGFRMADDEEGWIEDLYKPRRFADGAAPFSLERHIEDNRARYLDRILAPLQEAVRRNPFQAEYRTRLGWELTYRHQANDYLTRWLPAADRSMEAAAHYAGNWMQNPHLHVDLGNYWVYRSRALGYAPAESEVAWIKALWHYYKAQELDPANKRFREEIRRYVQSLYPDDPRVREALKQ